MTPTTTMTSSSGCGCGSSSSTCSCADTGFAERPRFFPRQMVTPDDLTLGQDYIRNKMRRHNRYLHGWGVVCGGRVVLPATPQAWKVVVQTGYFLGPYGDEIMIDHDRCFDLRSQCLSGVTGDPCAGSVPDPMCSGSTSKPPAGPVYVAVRYQDSLARPVRVQPVGCGCDDTMCEYSRCQDGYEICVLTQCPGSHQNPPGIQGFGTPQGIPDCPPCPTDPWVVLATVTMDANGNVQTIDNCSCRRMVVSPAPYWSKCSDPAISPQAATPPPPPANPPAPAGKTKP
jgi:hypothetical protein